MTNIEFEKLLAERLEKTRKVLGVKRAEYSSEKDRLHNFKSSAELQMATCATTPVRELWGMAKKHIISVQDMVFSHEKPSNVKIDEKIGDTINYLILLEALFKESE
jgi:hypothetical protein